MRLFSVFLIGLFLSTACARGARVAVVAPGAETAGDLLTAALSKEAGVELVEREQLARIAGERGISKTTEAARLANADALVFLETSGSGTNVFGSLRLVAAKPGVVLFSTRLMWPPADLAGWAENVAAKLAGQAAKAAVPAERANKISVLNLRSASTSAAEQRLERELTALLLARLGEEPGLFVLERRGLAAAVFEKELAASEEKFWTGSHLLDGTINGEAFDAKRVTIAARLRGPDGSEAKIEAAGAREELGKVIEELATKILASLKIEKRAVWDPAKEAAQQLAEAKWGVRFGMWREAQAAADAAWALGERSLEAATTRLLAYGRDVRIFNRATQKQPERRIQWPYNPPPADAVEPMLQAVELMEQTLAQDFNAITNRAWWDAARESLDNAGEVLENFFWRAEAREGVAEKLAELRAIGRRVFEKAIRHPAVSANYWFPAGETRSPDALNSVYDSNARDIYSLYAARAAMFQETPEGTAEVFRTLVSGDAYPYIRRHVLETARTSLGGWKWGDRKREMDALEKFIAELAASTNVTKQLEGKILRLALLPDSGGFTQGQLGAREKMTREIEEFLVANKEALKLGPTTPQLWGLNLDYKVTSELDREFYSAVHGRHEANKYKGDIAKLKESLREKRPIPFSEVAKLHSAEFTKAEAEELLGLLVPYVEESPNRNSVAGQMWSLERQLAKAAGLPQPDRPRFKQPETNAAPLSAAAQADFNERRIAMSNRVAMMRSNRFAGGTNLAGGTNRMPFGPGGPMFRGPGMAGRFDPFGRNAEPPPETVSTTNVIVARDFWAAPKPRRTEQSGPFSERAMTEPILREGLLWTRHFYESVREGMTWGWKTKLLGVNPETLKVEQEVELDAEKFAPAQTIWLQRFDLKLPRTFEVLDGKIFVVGANGLMRRERAGGEWQKFAAPAEQSEIWRVGTNLYLASSNSLHLLSAKDGSAQTLATVRRRPAVTALDELETLAGMKLTSGPQGRLRALAGSASFLFDGKDWARETAVTNGMWEAFDDAAFAKVTRNLWAPMELHALAAGKTKAELAARAMQSRPGVSAPTRETNWNFSSISIASGRPFMLGTNAALLCARGEAWTDGAHAKTNTSRYDIFVFGPAKEMAVRAQLELDLGRGPAPVAGQLARGFQAWVLPTEKYIFAGHVAQPGFWRISRAEVEAEIARAVAAKTEEAK